MEERPFYPSNSDHGYWFESKFCQNCAGYFNGHCRVLINAMAFGKSDHWVYLDDQETCKKFKDKLTHKAAKKVSKKQGSLYLI